MAGMPRLPIVLVVLAIAGCGLRQKPLPERDAGRRTISEGYSILYYAVSEQKWLSKILLLKPKSDALKRLVERTSKYSGELQGKLEELAKQYPAIHLGPPPPSEIEQRARQSEYKEQLKEILFGTSGRESERLLLLSQYTVLDQLRHLARVMVEAETEANRRAFWKGVQDEFEEEHRQVVDLLEREFARGQPSRVSRR
jgi:hypothetical protein